MQDISVTVQAFPQTIEVTDTPINITVNQGGIQGPAGGGGGSSAGVISLNSLDGVLNISGQDLISIYNNGQTIYVSGNNFSGVLSNRLEMNTNEKKDKEFVLPTIPKETTSTKDNWDDSSDDEEEEEEADAVAVAVVDEAIAEVAAADADVDAATYHYDADDYDDEEEEPEEDDYDDYLDNYDKKLGRYVNVAVKKK